MGANNFVLFESASGYAIFEVIENEEIGSLLTEVQASVADISSFGRIVKLKAFQPFTSAENALENINNISEGLLSDDLKNFLEMNLPKVKASKKGKFTLGVQDKSLAQAISDELSVSCNTSETTLEIVRGVRMHFDTFVKELAQGNLAKAQLGLGHSYSRAKVKFNVNRADNMIIQAIALLDQMDKDINTFAMRVREWYSWHFPELVKIVNDNYVYARCASFIKNRNSLSEDSLEELAKIVLDEDKAQQILHASRSSMGMDMSEIDMINIDNFTSRLVNLAEYRRQLHQYLVSKMSTVAPNLASLIGESVGARLISHAGSLTNLAKCPASTVQILGAEKALFRALKTRGNTPKYGLLFHSTFIGRAAAKNKGRISRYLANKCAIASRIDSFIDEPTTKYGDKMREQVEERLSFYESGAPPRKNADVMQEVSDELKKDALMIEKKPKKNKKSKKRPLEDEDLEVEEKQEPSERKSKKAKKNKKQNQAEEEKEAAVAPAVDTDKKKKKKHKKKAKLAE
ncbi:nucleolar protein nop56 [Plasmopara halstedii]|uniref:Nucleolar protein 56 n=1 Tax=Plasmopara halstedii TaxID=4781 RepID=A0A0P1B6X2_PLAHL|nr:nucleolar protein nop56 [Plasmopara halstedii]CEG50254.1 nucleolar protein nop56 [Plasmopara halstedii]|eukprot:XP_024586623.1 nucleolar protein nop56 [Plasmopara halstedii]